MTSINNHPTTGSTPATAIILAAGVGRRLDGWEGPKVLLEFAGKTLLERHLAALHENGVTDVFLTVGHMADAIEVALEKISLPVRVRLVMNEHYREGSIVSLAAQGQIMRSGQSVLLMDGDVLYDQEILRRLISAEDGNILLLDRNIEPGDEPVKICVRGDAIVDFRKVPEGIPYDWHGESVGFFRFSAAMAANLADRCEVLIDDGHRGIEYEEAIRHLIMEMPSEFGFIDISSFAWTEIDFGSDVAKAQSEVLPLIEGKNNG